MEMDGVYYNHREHLILILEATEMKKISNKEILIGAVAYKLNCSEECLKGYTKAELKKMLEN